MLTADVFRQQSAMACQVTSPASSLPCDILARKIASQPSICLAGKQEFQLAIKPTGQHPMRAAYHIAIQSSGKSTNDPAIIQAWIRTRNLSNTAASQRAGVFPIVLEVCTSAAISRPAQSHLASAAVRLSSDLKDASGSSWRFHGS